jgi:hypothetical protein
MVKQHMPSQYGESNRLLAMKHMSSIDMFKNESSNQMAIVYCIVV